MSPDRQPQRPAAACPDCGWPVSRGAKLCPQCGYPLLFEAGPGDEVQPGYLRKPMTEERDRGTDTGVFAPPPAPGRPAEVLGPYCPSCGHRNPPRRVRCEICAHELWPGSAAPGRSRVAPVPTAPPPRPRRVWVTVVAVAAVAVAAMFLLAYALG